MAKKDRQFWESAAMNNATFKQYYNRLVELAISMFEWKNLPDSVDARFLELCLFVDGQAIFFYDEELGYLTLQNAMNGGFNVYRIPVNRRAYAVNGYNRELNENNSVIIFNNYLHTNSKLDAVMFAKRLYNLDRAIDVNANAMKTPIIIKCDETQRLTMLNLYKQYDGNEPYIFGDKAINTNAIQVFKTDAPYVADKLYQLKTQIWNEALTYLGISNINVQKKERLITDEVTRNQGGTIASRYSRLNARRDACKQINAMFGLDIWCDYREDYQMIDTADDTVKGDPDSDGEGGVVE
jgi:hypothetical protein